MFCFDASKQFSVLATPGSFHYDGRATLFLGEHNMFKMNPVIKIWVTLIVFFVSSSAFAASPMWCSSILGLSGLYGGFGIGFSKTQYSPDNQFVTVLGKTLPLSATTVFPPNATIVTKNKGWGGRLYTGYKFRDIFALELGLAKAANTTISNVFGISDGDAQAIPLIPNTTIKGNSTSVKQLNLDLMGKIDIPLMEAFHGFFQVGAAYIQLNHPSTVEANVTHPSPGMNQINLSVKNLKDYTMRPAFALGAGYVADSGMTIDLTVYKILASGKNIGLNFGSKIGDSLIQDSMLVMIGMGFGFS